MNPSAIPSLIPLVVNAFLGVHILCKNPGNRVNRAFAMLMLSISSWCFGEFMMRNTFNVNTGFFWAKATWVAVFFLPAFLLHFSIIFTGKQSFPVLSKIATQFCRTGFKKKYYPLLIYPPSIIFTLLLGTNLIISGVVEKYWGFTAERGILMPFFMIYFLFFGGYALLLIYRKHNKTENPVEQLQLRYVFVGVATPIVVGGFFQIILPVCGVDILPLGSVSTIVLSVFIAAAIIKYNLFHLKPMKLLPGFAKKTEYTTFLNKLLSETSKKDYSDFNRYLKETGMGKIASFRDGNIETHFEKMGSLNLFDVCEKTMEYMEKDYENLAEDFLPVMNSMYSRLTHVSDETDKIFTSIIKKHENFLTKTGIIYGFADGKFLSVIKGDVLPEDDADAFLKVYRRIFLSITGSINTLGADRFRIISAGGEYTRMLGVQNGVVSMDEAVKKLRVLQREARITKLRDDFNLLLNIIYKELPEKDAKKMLESIGVVFKLNKKAARLGICPNILFEIICNELPVKNKIKTCFPNAEYKNALLRMNAEILSYNELAEKTNMLVPLFGKEKVTELSEKYGVGL